MVINCFAYFFVLFLLSSEHNIVSEPNQTVSFTESLNTLLSWSLLGGVHPEVLEFIREILQSWECLLPTYSLSHSNLFFVSISKYLYKYRDSGAVIFCFAFNLIGKDRTTLYTDPCVYACVCMCVCLHLLSRLSPQLGDPLLSTVLPLRPIFLCDRGWCWTHTCSTCAIFSTVTTSWRRRMQFYKRKKMRGLVLSCGEPKVSNENTQACRCWNLAIHSACVFHVWHWSVLIRSLMIWVIEFISVCIVTVLVNSTSFGQQSAYLLRCTHACVCVCVCKRVSERACRPSGSVILGGAVSLLSHLFIPHGIRL